MIFNTQTDSNWRKDTMGIEADTLGRWGCVITSCANILQDTLQMEYTPRKLNKIIKNHNGYSGKKGIESFLKWEMFCSFFCCKLKRELKTSEYKQKDGWFRSLTRRIRLHEEVSTLGWGLDRNQSVHASLSGISTIRTGSSDGTSALRRP